MKIDKHIDMPAITMKIIFYFQPEQRLPLLFDRLHIEHANVLSAAMHIFG